ncbi:hypothetical protein ON010_g6192 [Phytophthora cinnamomi]|nr:hypothetical protein ON010_g6192 [Phytophthora cinnamomi]
MLPVNIIDRSGASLSSVKDSNVKNDAWTGISDLTGADSRPMLRRIEKGDGYRDEEDFRFESALGEAQSREEGRTGRKNKENAED